MLWQLLSVEGMGLNVMHHMAKLQEWTSTDRAILKVARFYYYHLENITALNHVTR